MAGHLQSCRLDGRQSRTAGHITWTHEITRKGIVQRVFHKEFEYDGKMDGRGTDGERRQATQKVWDAGPQSASPSRTGQLSALAPR
jgi:hypothetical protein